MPQSPYRISLTSAIGALLFAAWLVACAVWTQVLLRWNGCGHDDIHAAFFALSSRPAGCSSLTWLAFELGPVERHQVLLWFDLPQLYLPVWGLGLLALASICTIIVARWQFHIRSDAFALATLWAGTLLHAIPRLQTGGVTYAELTIGSMELALADLYIFSSILWLLVRFVAESRA